MMQFNSSRLLAALGVAAGLGMAMLSGSAQATPAFARQMDMPCLSCHSQALTTLNSFGRQFKLSGFSMSNGSKSMITGMGDLPMAVNAGAGLKANYTTSDDPAVRDLLSVPAGASIFFGGKIAENAGANTMWNGDGLIHLQATFAQPVGAGRAGVSIFGSQGHGPFISTESYNTGLHKELSVFENVTRTNAAQATGVGSGPASGLTAFYGGHGLTATVGMWAKGFNSVYSNKGLDSDGIDQTLFRLAYDVPSIGSWDVMVGAFRLDGSTTGTPCKLFENTATRWATCFDDGNRTDGWFNWATRQSRFETSASGLDMQLQGAIAGMSTQLVLTHVSDWKFKVTDVVTPAAPRPNQSSKATSLEGRMMVMPSLGVSLGHMKFDDRLASNADYSTTSLGLIYNYAENIRFSLERSAINNKASADVDETTLQVLIGF